MPQHITTNPVAALKERVQKAAKRRAPKNGKIRRVYLSADAVDICRGWLALLPGYAPHNPEALVFPGARGARGWHDLRQSCASSLVAGWWGRRWTLEEVREHLGHTSIASTHRYAHLSETAIEGAVRRAPGWAPRLPTSPPRFRVSFRL